jgi:hypothetical protein
MTSPLRGPKSPEGGGFAAAHPSDAPRRVRGRPSGPQGAPHRAARDSPSGAALDPGGHCGPWDQEKRQAKACPRATRGAKTRSSGHSASTRTRRKQTNWRSANRRRKITGVAAGP